MPLRFNAPRERSPGLFFGLVAILTVPFWVVSAIANVELLPGLPLAALSVVCPAIAALALTYQAGGLKATFAMARRAFDCRKVSLFWYIPILLINSLIAVVSFAILSLAGTNLPTAPVSILPTLALAAVMVVSALCEELGWSGYAADPMRRRWGTVRAGILIGIAWAAWHIVPLVEVGRSFEWIAWWSLGTIAARVIMMWLHRKTGRSIFGVAIYHACLNICWQLFPIQGSYFDPRINGLITAAVASLIVLSAAAGAGRRPKSL